MKFIDKNKILEIRIEDLDLDINRILEYRKLFLNFNFIILKFIDRKRILEIIIEDLDRNRIIEKIIEDLDRNRKLEYIENLNFIRIVSKQIIENSSIKYMCV